MKRDKAHTSGCKTCKTHSKFIKGLRNVAVEILESMGKDFLNDVKTYSNKKKISMNQCMMFIKLDNIGIDFCEEAGMKKFLEAYEGKSFQGRVLNIDEYPSAKRNGQFAHKANAFKVHFVYDSKLMVEYICEQSE